MNFLNERKSKSLSSSITVICQDSEIAFSPLRIHLKCFVHLDFSSMLYERYQNFENRTYQDPTCFTSFSFIESRTLCLLPISTDGAFGQIPSPRTGYYAKRSGASSMLIKKLIFFRAFQTKYLLISISKVLVFD